MLDLREALDGKSREEMRKYSVDRLAGEGTFGTVLLARIKETDTKVAIKKVLQDPRFRNRELKIMQELAKINHPNIVYLHSYFYTCVGESEKEIYLNAVMDFVPDTLHSCYRSYFRRDDTMPALLTKVFMYQLIRSIACLQLPSVNVCHRDIKPHNVLVDEVTGVLKLCDFGSAKNLVPSEPNVAYICSRYYRAPELIFGSPFYTPAVDVWSVGCIFAEIIHGRPVFRGYNSHTQLQAIAKVLGRPTPEQLRKLDTHKSDILIPNVSGTTWEALFPDERPEVHDLLGKLLQYVPEDRVTPMEALCHPYFDELHDKTSTLPSGKSLPTSLFQFLPQEIEAMTDAQKQHLLPKCVP